MTANTQNANIAAAAMTWKMDIAITTSFMGSLLSLVVDAFSGFHMTRACCAGLYFVKLRRIAMLYLSPAVIA
jgi:hypothetical protein